MPDATTAVALLGDVVTSRRFVDQAALLTGLDEVLQRVSSATAHLQPLRLGIRDEFRGTFPTVADAVEAALRLRLGVADLVLATVDDEDEPVDVRVGLGEGEVVLADHQSPTGHQSGPAWWGARDALDAAFELPTRSQYPRSLRTVFRCDDDARAGAVNAYLLCQDQLFARMDLRDRRALLGLLDGERQVDVANALGITQPAVARRLRDRGALAIKRGLESLHAPAPD